MGFAIVQYGFTMPIHNCGWIIQFRSVFFGLLFNVSEYYVALESDGLVFSEAEFLTVLIFVLYG